MSGMERPIRVEVDGEVFNVVARRDHPDQYDYEWTSRPNSGYGFFRRHPVVGQPWPTTRKQSGTSCHKSTRYGLHRVEDTDIAADSELAPLYNDL